MKQAPVPSISSSAFGTTALGEKVLRYTMRNLNGASVSIITYGGIVTSLNVPDNEGKLADVVLGFSKLSDYEENKHYFGCLVGRYGNRIAKGRFTLAGHKYQLATNNNGQALHGGLRGFDKVVWNAIPVMTKQGPSLRLNYLSGDGEEGYPGNLSVTATYTLSNKNELKLIFRAKTDKTTIVNLTHHSYFNLAGHGRGDILGHNVTIHANKFTPVDKFLIPTGKLAAVKGSPFDFRVPTTIGARISLVDQQLRFCRGYDHNWVAAKPLCRLGRIARVEEPKSGRVMEVITSEPGVQFYTGNFLDGISGKGGKKYNRYDGFCFEPQHFPDSPNRKNFPSTMLMPGEIYKNSIIYKFLTN
jgi:aldose 1-epimerase